MKVFLGGSLNQTTWRQDVAIPTLERAGIEYCLPGADNPDHACDCDVLLYVVDRQTRALKTCADAISSSIGKANVVLVVQHLIGGSYLGTTILGQEETKQANEFRDSVKAICAGLGAEVFSEVEDALRFIVTEHDAYVLAVTDSFGTGVEATTETEESQLPNNDYVNEVVPEPTAEPIPPAVEPAEVLAVSDAALKFEVPEESLKPFDISSIPPENLAEVVIDNINKTYGVTEEQPVEPAPEIPHASPEPVAEVEQLPPSEPTNE